MGLTADLLGGGVSDVVTDMVGLINPNQIIGLALCPDYYNLGRSNISASKTSGARTEMAQQGLC